MNRIPPSNLSLEEFARRHSLPERWLRLRHQCEAAVRDPRFWYAEDLQTVVRQWALEASNLLQQQPAGPAPQSPRKKESPAATGRAR